MKAGNWIVGGTLIVVACLLAAVLIVLVRVMEDGVQLRIAQPVELGGSMDPQEAHVTVVLAEPVVLEVSDEIQLRAHLEGLDADPCETGMLLPVRWNILTGRLEWECVEQGSGDGGR